MGYTRRQFCEGAFEELGLASYDYDISTNHYTSAMRHLDSLMAEWNAKGLRLSYPIPSTPGGGSLDDETNVPDRAWTAIITNLALRVAPMFGKQVQAETKVMAKQAWNTLVAISTIPLEIQMKQLPAGAGNKPWRYDRVFTDRPTEPLEAGPDSELEFY